MTHPKAALIVLLLYVILVALLFTDCPPPEPPQPEAARMPKPEADKIIRDDLQQKRGS